MWHFVWRRSNMRHLHPHFFCLEHFYVTACVIVGLLFCLRRVLLERARFI